MATPPAPSTPRSGARAHARQDAQPTPNSVPARLSPAVQPKAYELALTLNPALPRYQGQVQIDIVLGQPLGAIPIHAQGLQISSAFIETGAHRWAAKLKPLDAELTALLAPKLVPAGPARLVIGFSGPLSATASQGLLRRQSGGRWWALARFDPQGARLALPVLDEPGWLVPWRLSLTVPEGLQALANTPLAQQEPAEPGFTRWRFEPTPPLPSHQLAFAVGALELQPAGQAGPVPLRWALPAGAAWPTAEALAASLAGTAIHITQHLARLEATLGQPYPYTLLDLLVLPPDSGLATASQPGLLAWPLEAGTAPLDHALARGWLGQLLSPANAADRRLLDALAAAAARLGDAPRGEAAAAPAPSTSATSDPASPLQLALAQAQAALGPAAWQAVLKRFVERHAWGLASAADFLAVLAAADAAQAEGVRQALSEPPAPSAPQAKPPAAVKP